MDQFPFLTLLRYVDTEYIGVIGNSDGQFTSMYVYTALAETTAKELYLSLADEWWWETNRKIPINIALKDRWKPFRSTLRHFVSKDVEIINGPVTSLDNLDQKRLKKRRVQLIKEL